MPNWTATELLARVLYEGREGVARSPEKVEDMTGVSGRTVRRLEDGSTAHPRAVTLDTLAKFYGLDPDFLRALSSWEDINPIDLARRIRELAAERFGGDVDDVAEDADDPVLWLAMRLARTGVRRADAEVDRWAMVSRAQRNRLVHGFGGPGSGKTGLMAHAVVALAADSHAELTVVQEIIADLSRLDGRRTQLVRDMVRELRIAQERAPDRDPVAD